MIVLVCSVKDAKVGTFGGLMCFRSRGEAVRMFGDMCKDAQLPFGKHPEDYDLYCFGAFDDNGGSFELFKQPERWIGASEY